MLIRKSATATFLLAAVVTAPVARAAAEKRVEIAPAGMYEYGIAQRAGLQEEILSWHGSTSAAPGKR